MPNMAPFGAFNSPAGFGGFPNFGNHPVQMPTGWAGGMQATMGGDGGGMHQGGPIRRGGLRGQNNRFAPYDRRGGHRNSTSGRLSPRGAGGLPGGFIGGDGAQGARGIGPSEATAGRTMKSYQDLDAVGGGGGGAGGELNY